MNFSEIINPLNTRNNAKGAAPFRDAYDNPGSADACLGEAYSRNGPASALRMHILDPRF